MKRQSFAAFILVSIAACGPAQLYTGARLPATEVSRVYVYSSGGVELSSLAVDGKGQGMGNGFEVLPGSHTFSAGFETGESDCLFGSNACGVKIFRGQCDATLSAEPGVDYSIRITGMGKSAVLEILEEGSESKAGSGGCQIRESRYGSPESAYQW